METGSDPTKMTRAKAERILANTADADVIRLFEKHGNKHVAAKARRKLLLPEEQRQGFRSSKTV